MDLFERLRERAIDEWTSKSRDEANNYGWQPRGGIEATIEVLKEMMAGEPLSGLLFGRGIVIVALELELPGQGEIEEGIDPESITLDRYVPIDNWWDDLIEAAHKRPDNHKG